MTDGKESDGPTFLLFVFVRVDTDYTLGLRRCPPVIEEAHSVLELTIVHGIGVS